MLAERVRVSIGIDIGECDDTSGSPGGCRLVAGTMEEGFFGEVPASKFITGDALASECGISQGTSQYSTTPWLKFAYKGEMLFVSKKPIRHSISWDAINTANCVYGDSGDKTVVIGGKTYKVTLMRALEPSNDPKTIASGSSGAVNHYSEWNSLMLPISIYAKNGNWAYLDYVESDLPYWGVDFTDEDLITNSVFGDGSGQWCQEVGGENASSRVYRGYGGVEYSDEFDSSGVFSDLGWRPVLRLIEED